jgi:Tol biopolymer transport system component
MKIKQNFVFIALFFIAIGISFNSCSEDTIGESGTGTITGFVVFLGTNEPLANVKMSTNPNTSTVFTGEDGSFILENVTVGDYSVQAQKTDLITEFEPASVSEGATVNVIFELQPETANNLPPTIPQLVAPADNEIDVPIETTFTWISNDLDPFDELEFTVELRNDDTDEIENFTVVSDTMLTVSDLAFSTKYFWQVTADDGVNTPVNSEFSSFETAANPNNRFLFVREEDGNNVIYSTGDADQDGGTSEIQLTDPTLNSWRPRKNNATSKIAFLRSVGGETQLFTMDEDGDNVFQVTDAVSVAGFNLDEVDFSWEPNGARLLFPSFDKLFAINIDGSGLDRIYETPDGSLITEIDRAEFFDLMVLKTNNITGYDVRIFTLDLDGNEIDTILENVDGGAGGIQISADGTKIVYTYDVSEFENPNYRQLDSRLFLYDLITNTSTDISGEKDPGTNDLDPRFDPTDALLIFVNTPNDGISQKNLQQLVISDSSRDLFLDNSFMPDWE